MKFHLLLCALCFSALHAAEPLLEKSAVLSPGMDGIARYHISGIVVTTKDAVLTYSEARRNSSADWGEIEMHLCTLSKDEETLRDFWQARSSCSH